MPGSIWPELILTAKRLDVIAKIDLPNCQKGVYWRYRCWYVNHRK